MNNFFKKLQQWNEKQKAIFHHTKKRENIENQAKMFIRSGKIDQISLLLQDASFLTNDEQQQLQILIKKEKRNWFQKLFYTALKEKDLDKCHSILPEIQSLHTDNARKFEILCQDLEAQIFQKIFFQKIKEKKTEEAQHLLSKNAKLLSPQRIKTHQQHIEKSKEKAPEQKKSKKTTQKKQSFSFTAQIKKIKEISKIDVLYKKFTTKPAIKPEPKKETIKKTSVFSRFFQSVKSADALLRQRIKKELSFLFKKTQNVSLNDEADKLLDKIDQDTKKMKDIDSHQNVISKDKTEKDILENILQQKKETENKIKIQKKETIILNPEDPENIINPFLPLLPWAFHIMIGGISVLFLSWFYFFLILNPNNTLLDLFEIDNTYRMHENYATELEEYKTGIARSEKQLHTIKQGSIDIPEKIALQEIQARKIDWLLLKNELERTTEKAFPYNDILKSITYTSFSGDSENLSIQIEGTITEPSGRVFFTLTRLIKIINEHPSFSGADTQSFQKTENSDEEVGGFTTNFSFHLKYHKQDL
ncbi:hypothetical protein COB57_06000 [Candidatus Peregrinibacteria bacterium]|nr:MAG: hypothetical protein COB57_06000 [Candidatus Peregrinibacteria bacterium]